MAKQRRLAFVLGGAKCVWADLEQARSLAFPDVVLAVNTIGVDYADHIDYLVSYHSDLLAVWARRRKERNLPAPTWLWTGKALSKHAPRSVKQHDSRGGSSGLLATQIALDDAAATHVILVGVPMDPTMRHYHDNKKGNPWKDGTHYHGHWRQRLSVLNGRVKSMSGWTKDLLGEPTKRWLEGD